MQYGSQQDRFHVWGGEIEWWNVYGQYFVASEPEMLVAG
jgi:hypothetical protein